MKTWEDIQKEPDIIYGLEVRKRREQLRISQRKLAKKIGVKQNTLIRYELGLDPCPKSIRNRIEEVLGPIEIAAELDGQKQTDKNRVIESSKEASLVSKTQSETESFDFAERLRRLKDRADILSQNNLARKLGVSSASVSHWLRGCHFPSSPEYRAWLIFKIEELESMPVEAKQLCLEENTANRPAFRSYKARRSAIKKRYEDFSELLIKTRSEYCMTIEEFGRYVGVDSGTISGWERLVQAPRALSMAKVMSKIEELRKSPPPKSRRTRYVWRTANEPAQSETMHEETAAACDPEPVFEDGSTPLPPEKPQDAPAAGSGKAHISSWLERVNILYKAGLDDLGDDDFRTVCGIIRGLRYSGQN